jgi:hypothetical protein
MYPVRAQRLYVDAGRLPATSSAHATNPGKFPLGYGMDARTFGGEPEK